MSHLVDQPQGAENSDYESDSSALSDVPLDPCELPHTRTVRARPAKKRKRKGDVRKRGRIHGPGELEQWAERANESYVYDKLVPLAAPGSAGVSTTANLSAAVNLSAQPDFKSQRSRIEEIVEDMGYLVMFYPKFHCELNWIEYYWGACKHYARKHCNYTLPGLMEAVPEALESVKRSLIFKYWRRAQRIIQAYREGVTFGDKDTERGSIPVTGGSHSESQAQMGNKLIIGVTAPAFALNLVPTTSYPLTTIYTVFAAYFQTKISVRQLGLYLPAP
ncbi:hypothetical protein FN846DRAFT_917608 [Sphaerosporella brunnea]|uniref:Tc1-like transposase DDE domain-containing protein n=1 Tax=Sphaerosporella brunnea TaxID=1250544 RepID=A0A5J5F387_9PEZI|nr:hypothetical protein FN846DRAFT_917608 [Sphaerosporella brunnea]